MVGSYGTDVGRCSRRSRGQRWLEETHFPMCCPAREGLRSKVSAIQPTFIMLTNFSPCFLNYWCGPQVHNYFLVWSEGQNGWTALLLDPYSHLQIQRIWTYKEASLIILPSWCQNLLLCEKGAIQWMEAWLSLYAGFDVHYLHSLTLKKTQLFLGKVQQILVKTFFVLYSIALHLSISIALLTAWASQKRSLPKQLTLCRSLHAEALQVTASEGLAQSPYVAARAGFEHTTFQSKGIDSTSAPPCPHVRVLLSLIKLDTVMPASKCYETCVRFKVQYVL